MADDKKLFFGIDLGTTFSLISYYRAGRPEVLPDQSSSEFVVPSAVYYPEGGDPVVGKSALGMAPVDPDRLVRWIKMSMGTDYRKTIGEESYTPEEISAEILKHLKRNAETALGGIEVTQAVLTVPAYFGDRERAATRQAGELAGLEVMSLLPEPAAAAYAYAIEGDIVDGESHILVYDLGGGTFDVTLLRASKVVGVEGDVTIETDVVAKDGSRALGGKHWDDAVVEYLATQCLEKHGRDPRMDDRALLDLRDRAIQAKHFLTDFPSQSVIVDAEGNTIELTREQFETETEGLLYQTEEKLGHVMESAAEKGISWSDLDHILLAGGSTRMPMVRAMLERVLAENDATAQIRIHGSVDQIVSLGAAYYAQICGGAEIVTQAGLVVRPTTIKDIGRAIGVIARENGSDVNVIVIPEGSEMDHEFTVDGLATEHDGQTSIDFVVTEGDSQDADMVERLGSATLTGLPGGRPAGQPVTVSLKYDSSGIITGYGLDQSTNMRVEIHVDRKAIAQ